MTDILQEVATLYGRELVALFLIFFLSHTTEAATGFGSNIISVSLGALFLPIDKLIPVILPVNIFLSIYVVTFYGKHIDKKVLGTRILPFMAAGMVLGLTIFNIADFSALKKWFGVFVICLTVFELVRLFKNHGAIKIKVLSLRESAAWLFSAGIIHGIYASSGPLVVYYAGKQFDDKKVFRSTLASLWLVLTITLMVSFIVTGKLNSETLAMSFMLLPSMIIGVVAGEYIHRVISEQYFRLFIYAVLLFAGLSLITG